MDNETPELKAYLPAIAVGIALFGIVILSYASSKNRTGTIVLPGGVTYLGPTPTITPHVSSDGKIPIPANDSWTERKGTKYPYSFRIPASLSLGVFPNDPFDSVTVFYPGTDANANIFFRVDDLNALGKSEFVGKPMEYAKNWWKDYAWKDVTAVTVFTNASGLTGYRATYVNDKGDSPYDHVFFTVPNKPHLVLWLSGKLFDTPTFDRIVNSVAYPAE